MVPTAEKLPYLASEYIRKRFRKEFLFEIKDHRHGKSQWNFVVEVSKDGYIYTLYFDESGNLWKEEADPAFPDDAHDGPGAGEVPE